MLNKAKAYIGFFAATFNIVAIGFFYDYFKHNYPGSETVSDAIAWWFVLGSLTLWVVYVILYIIGKFAKRRT